MLKESRKCSGCGACAESCPKHCITMQRDKEGFLYPKIDYDICVNCSICEKVCPVLHSIEVHPKVQSFAVQSMNDEVRVKSSSGGVFPIIAKYILDQGGYVCAAVYDEFYQVKHIISNEIEDIEKMQGAKYSQSLIYPCFGEIRKLLLQGKLVLVVGTPCQIQGIQNFLGRSFQTLLLIDMICHGVPSPNIWGRYIQERTELDAKSSKVKNVNMRSKESGWSRYKYSFEILYQNGIRYNKQQEEDLFMRGFTRNLYLRPSCSECSWKGVYRSSDITLGDYWGIWNQYSEFDDNKGTSLVWIHSEKAQAVWGKVKNQLKFIQVTASESYQENPSAIFSSKAHENRERFFELINEEKKITDAISVSLMNLGKTKKGLKSRVLMIFKRGRL